MTLVATAFKELKRHIVMNLITFLELTISVILVCVMVSAVMIRYKYYEPFSDVYSSQGLYCEFSVASAKGENMESMEDFIADDDIFQYLHSPEMIISSNRAMAFPLVENESVPCYCYSYNDELIKRYTPNLSDGKWFDNSRSADTLKAVVSENEYGWDVGDKIPVTFACNGWDGIIEVEIIGKLENGTKLPGIIHSHDGENNSNMFFSSYDYKDEKCPLVLFSYSQLNEKKVFQSLYSAMIKYPSDVTGQSLSDDQRTISSFGSLFSMKLSEINKNSIAYFKVQIYNYLPIIIVVLLLTLVSSISITALSTRQRLKDYGIYYVCGLKWKSCCIVNLFYSLIITVSSVFCATVLMIFSKYIPKLDQTVILWNIWVFISVLLISILFIIGSMMMPLIIIGKNTPKEVLAKGGI